MVTPVLILTLALTNSGPSATTLAAVKMFEVNVDRQWPTDEREPAVTTESLRLMAAATSAIVDDWKLNDGKLRDAIADFESARESFFLQARGDRQRAKSARGVLDDGRLMIDRLAAALRCADLTAKERATLKKYAEALDDDRPVREQVDQLEQYFQTAARLLRTMIDAAPSAT